MTTLLPTVPLLDAAFMAPLIAVSMRWPRTYHAITMESIVEGWDRATFTAACGESGLRIVGYKRGDDEPGIPVPWPPRAKGSPLPRCRECWVSTGKKRPRSTWTPK